MEGTLKKTEHKFGGRIIVLYEQDETITDDIVPHWANTWWVCFVEPKLTRKKKFDHHFVQNLCVGARYVPYDARCPFGSGRGGVDSRPTQGSSFVQTF